MFIHQSCDFVADARNGYFCQMQSGYESFRIKRPCHREATVGSHLRKKKKKICGLQHLMMS